MVGPVSFVVGSWLGARFFYGDVSDGIDRRGKEKL